MKQSLRHVGWSLPLVVLFMLAVTSVSRSVAQPLVETPGIAKIDRWVIDHTNDGQSTEFLVILNDQADLTAADRLTTKAAKGRYVYETLYAAAQRSQQPIIAWLQQRVVPYRSFYIVNAIWVKADRDTALALAARSEVARLDGNPAIANDFAQPARYAPIGPWPARPDNIEPGIQYVNAPAVWSLGFTGQGVVIGGQDTGYMWNHAALQSHYRGWNGITVTHDYNWHDSIHATTHNSSCGVDSPTPCDDYGHGTHTMGTLVGDDGGANQIGMAPGAQWMGCRNMDNGWGTPATYIECFEFFLAPYPVGGTTAQGDPSKAPDVTNNSWSCPPAEGCNAQSLLAATQAQRAAGILTVVSATNSGPSCSTISDPPAIYAEAYTVGALNTGQDTAASFSSRGPVTGDGSGRRKPDIAAPGTAIRSSTRDGGYGYMQGTSMAAPHVAGAVALVWSALPAYRRQITFTEDLLNDSAVHLVSTECGSNGWPNNTFGYGRLDVAAAVQRVITATQAAAPGSAMTYTLRLTNTTAITTPFDLETGSHQWPITMTPTQTTALPPGEVTVITVGVTIPSGVLATDFDALALVATASLTPTERQYFALNTHVLPVYGLTLAPSSATAMAVRGYAAAYTLQLTNTGNATDTYTFEVAQPSWPVAIVPHTLALAAQQHGLAQVLITAPLTAAIGMSNTAQLTAQGTGVAAFSELTTVVTGYGVALSPSSATAMTPIGQVATYTLQITNTGSFTDTFAFALSQGAWLSGIAPVTMTLTPQQSAGVLVSVTVPLTAAPGLSDTVRVSAQGTGPVAWSDLTTIATGYGFALSPVSATKTALIGQAATYTLYLTSTGNLTDAIAFDLSQNIWPVSITPITLTLVAQEYAIAQVSVTVPLTAAPGLSDTVRVSAQGTGEAAFSDLTTIATGYGFALSPVSATKTALIGQAATYTLYLTSTGNLTDAIAFDLSQNTWPVSITPITLTLAAHQHAAVQVLVSVPLTAAIDVSDIVRINAQGTGVAAFSELTTAAAGWRYLFPIFIEP